MKITKTLTTRHCPILDEWTWISEFMCQSLSCRMLFQYDPRPLTLMWQATGAGAGWDPHVGSIRKKIAGLNNMVAKSTFGNCVCVRAELFCLFFIYLFCFFILLFYFAYSACIDWWVEKVIWKEMGKGITKHVGKAVGCTVCMYCMYVRIRMVIHWWFFFNKKSVDFVHSQQCWSDFRTPDPPGYGVRSESD